jgi:hypothetical protein
MMTKHSRRRAIVRASTVLSLLLAADMFSAAALAQHRPGPGQGPGPGPGRAHRGAPPQWHGNIARFHEHDWSVWRGGRWTHARHGGRLGWWWIVGPTWYFYPEPMYPYPSPWQPSEVIITGPGGVVPMPPTQYWYYCEASRTYYPYVSVCPGGWQQVPATPDANAPAPIPRVP